MLVVACVIALAVSGCQATRSVARHSTKRASACPPTTGTVKADDVEVAAKTPPDASDESDSTEMRLVSAEKVSNDPATTAAERSPVTAPPEPPIDRGVSGVTPVSLEDVALSVTRYYPLVQAAWQERQVADGNQLSAWGEFDTKLKAISENQPLGFYETYRNSAGFNQPLYSGGEVFGGYRNGGGSFEPWYEERETNQGGEFKSGVRVPLIRDKRIDARRAEVWRRTYDQQLANPAIRASIIQFVAHGGYAYWKWVAAGQKYRLGQQWLELARSRNRQIERRVEMQDLDPPELTDNLRAIAKREAKLADSRRILEQAAAKLSLYLRDNNGRPRVPALDELPEFPNLRQLAERDIEGDITQARQSRPELQALQVKLQQLQIDYAEACNLTRPRLDAQLTGSQDVGQPTSSTRDKSEFEVEASLYFDFPLQQRKGRGKAFAVQARMAQVSAKRRLVDDKVRVEVQAAYAGLNRSREEAEKAETAAELANQMADIERRKFELGESDLLKVALREQYALEAAEEQVSAAFNHFTAFTDYAAALSIEQPTIGILPGE